MRFNKTAFALLLTLFMTGVALGQDKDKSLGGIKGKVRVETGSASGVTVVVRRGETEVTRVETQKGGDFSV
ncbi:MAG TPA: hypothetical protein VHQ94_19635, partial [Pyrinomonadaceae bacterium]|nr:hypothetical protein [Pyrinomonadaceae bacterium]